MNKTGSILESAPAKVDLNMVLTLQALFDTGQVSKAAAALDVSQPTVSQTLKRLREYFGDPLFVRSGNALRATPRALELQAPIGRIAREIGFLSQRPPSFDPGTAAREFVISMTDIAEFLGLPQAIAQFSAEAPHCAIRSVRAKAEQLQALLEDGQLDLAFGAYSGVNETLRQSKLGHYDFVCCTAGALQRPLGADDYLDGRHVVVPRSGEAEDYAAAALKRLGFARRVVLRLPNYFAAIAAVAESGLMATLPRPAATRLAKYFAIHLHELPIDIGRVSSYMVWHERFHRDPSHQWLRSLLARNYVLPGGAAEGATGAA